MDWRTISPRVAPETMMFFQVRLRMLGGKKERRTVKSPAEPQAHGE